MSDPTYTQVGVAIYDTMVLQNPDGTFVTGKVQADFTLSLAKNGVDGASTAGVTITEIGTGRYAVYAPPGAFPATTGAYELVIYLTSDPRFSFEALYWINIGGSASTTGVAFTATVGDGRVLSGGNPLASATVILSLGGSLFATTTTDVAGVWGPVYFTTDGVYTITIQKSGYANTTSTLTISGGATIATGPGTDLSVTASTTNPLIASELWAYFTRQARDVGGPKAVTERVQGVQDAVDMLAKESKFNWLLRRDYITLHGAVSLSISVTNGSAVGTLLSGTFPTWAATGRVLIQAQVLDIVSLDSPTQITFKVAWANATAAYTGIVFQDEYAMPDSMMLFHKLIPFQRWGYGGSPISAGEFYTRQAAVVYQQRFPSCWTLHNGKLMLYPYPQTNETLCFTYYKMPAYLTVAGDILDWDPAQVEVIRRAIDVQVCYRYGSYAGGTSDQAHARYKEAMAKAITTDKESTGIRGGMESGDMWQERLNRTDWHRRSV